MLTPREKYCAIIANDTLKKSNAIVLLEGDGFSRVPETVRLFGEGWAPMVVVSGGVDKPDAGCFPAPMLARALLDAGLPRESLLEEGNSLHTQAQAEEVMKLVGKHGWKRIILVASHYHQYRAYLTFLAALKKTDLSLELINAPARNLPWGEKIYDGTRLELLEAEFDKIELYREHGHVASFEAALEYQLWKEQQ